MKRALIFWPFNALGTRTGAHQVQLADLMALIKLGYEITLFASDLYGDPDTAWNIDEMKQFERKCKIKIHLSQASAVDRLFILNQQISHPDRWGMYHNPWLLREFHELFLEVQPDLVIINYARWGKLAIGQAFKSATRILRSVDLLEVNDLMLKKISPFLKEPVVPERVDSSIVDEALCDVLYERPYVNESKEIQAYNAYDAVVAITDSDAQTIRTHTTGPSVSCVPTACSVEYVENSYDGLPFFVGSTYPLNIQGYVYFVRKVLPLVLEKISGFCLQAVGGFSRKVEGVQGVELLGYVPDLKPLYTASRFTICPMLGGTGSQIKILESMAYGVPVIAMSAVARASPIEHGVNGLIASNADEFAEHVIRLYTDSDLCRKLGSAARQTIAEQFSLEQSVERWRAAISKAEEPTGRHTAAKTVSPKSQSPEKVHAMPTLREAVVPQPKISVVTPTKNCAQYVRGCIESVLAQNYDNFEHIIVDGASTDETVMILKEYPHLKWVSEPDDGEAEALNKALAMADGDIISWLNADDNYFGHDVFRIVASEMKAAEGRHLVYGKTLLTDEQQAIAWLQIPRMPITLPILMRWFDLIELYQPSIFYSKELVQTIGQYREDLFFSIDYEYWLRIAAQGYSFHYVDHVLSQSRLFRESGKSALPKKEQEESWTRTATAFQHHLSEVERIHFWKDYYRYQLPYLKQSSEPITPPDDEWAQIGLALVLRGCGVNAEVVKLLEQTTTGSPQCSDAYWLLGDELLRGTKDYDRAKPILEQAQALTWSKQQEAVKGQPSSGLNPNSSTGDVRLAVKADMLKDSAPPTSKNQKKYASAQDRSLRVLFQNRPNAMSHPGGDTLVMNKLKDGLEQLGVHVDIALGQSALKDYDLVHLFNFATPEYTEQCAREAIQAGIPFAVTTLFEDWPRFLSKCSTSLDLFKQYFKSGFDEQQFATYLNQIGGLPSVPPSENSFVAQHAACLFASGEAERRRLLEIYPDSKRVEVVKFGMDHLSADVGPELFYEKYHVKDYVLCVGRLETRKNQLMLLKSLQHEQIPIVFVTGGVTYQPEYEDLCRRFPRNAPTLFVDRLSDDMLASCYRGARVFCLPSWYELPGIVTIEAARFGCAVAATSWGTLKDYLPYGVHYCEPDDPHSIREAILQAMSASPPQVLQKDASLYTWTRTVDQLVGLYHDILSQAKESTVQDVSLSPSISNPNQPVAPVMHAKLKDAQEALAQGRLDDAKKHLEKLFQHHPTHSEGWLVSGVLSMQSQSLQEAVDAFSKALRFGGDDRKCRMGLAMALIGKGEARESQEVLLAVLKDHPDDEEAIHWLIRACTALEDWEKLENSLDYYLQRNPANCSVRFALASVQVKQKKVDDAKMHLESLQLLSPNFEGLDDLEELIKNQISSSQIGGYENKQVERQSQFNPRLKEEVQIFQNSEAGDGSIPKSAQQPVASLDGTFVTDCIDLLIKIVSSLPVSHLSKKQHAAAQLYMGIQKLPGSTYTQTRRFVRLALDEDPESSYAYALLGLSLLKSGEIDRALMSFDSALGLDPKCLPALGGKVLLLRIRAQDAGLTEETIILRHMLGGVDSAIAQVFLRVLDTLGDEGPLPTRYLNIGGGPHFSHPYWCNLEAVKSETNPEPFHFHSQCVFPLADKSLSLVYSSHCFEHLDDPSVDRALGEAHRVIKNDGALVLKIPDFDRALETWRLEDQSFMFRPVWDIERLLPMWRRRGLGDNLHSRTSVLFCGFWNDAYGDADGHFSGERSVDGDAYMGPPLLPDDEMEPLIARATPHTIAAALRKWVIDHESNYHFCHQNAWSRKELEELLSKHRFRVLSFNIEQIKKRYHWIPDIDAMDDMSTYCFAVPTEK